MCPIQSHNCGGPNILVKYHKYIFEGLWCIMSEVPLFRRFRWMLLTDNYVALMYQLTKALMSNAASLSLLINIVVYRVGQITYTY